MNLGFPEMLFILVVALLIFGPKKLPEIGRQVGKAMSEFKRASDDFKAQLDSEVRQLEMNETRQRVAASSSEPEVSISPPEGTVPATSAYGEIVDAELSARPESAAHDELTRVEHGEAAAPAASPESEHAQAASASYESSSHAETPAVTSAASTAAPGEVTATAPAENRNG
jgi:sec-independent protein translocase protein TatB